MAFKVVMTVKFKEIERYFEFDVCNPPKFSQSARFAEQPIQNGNTVSDHMWLVPSTFTLDGAFSLTGSWAKGKDQFTMDYIVQNDTAVQQYVKDTGLVFTNHRLSNIQTFFRWIQRTGTLVSMTFADVGGTLGYASPTSAANCRFTKKENLALESVSWTEGFQSMSFSMSFKEIMEVSTEMFEQIANKLMPFQGTPSTKSVNEVIQSMDGLYATVIETLIDRGYIAVNDAKVAATAKLALERLGSTTEMINTIWAVSAALVIAVAAITASYIVTATFVGSLAAAAGVSATVPVAGWIVAGIIAIVGATVLTVSAVNKHKQEQAAANKLRKGFNLIRDFNQYIEEKNGEVIIKDTKDAKANEEDVNKLVKFLNTCINGAVNAANDIRCYEITSDKTDNTARKFTLPVGSAMLNITIGTLVNSDGNTEFDIKIEEYATPMAGSKKEIAKESWQSISTFAEGDNSNYIYYNEVDGTYLYLVQLNEPGENLADYIFVTSTKSLQEVNTDMTNAIMDTMKSYGFDA